MSDFQWHLFERLPIVGILRGFSAEHCLCAAAAAFEGGLTMLEVTMNTKGAPEIIATLTERFGDVANIGAGTVCDTASLEMARSAGASFIVTPIVDEDVITRCVADGVPVFPGAMTPTEIHRAHSLGAPAVKVFPADTLGPAYIRAVKAPLPHIKLIPTGGVTLETIRAFRDAGADGYGIGGPLFDKARILAGDWTWLTRQTAEFAERLWDAPAP